jgi:hypothetical protein
MTNADTNPANPANADTNPANVDKMRTTRTKCGQNKGQAKCNQRNSKNNFFLRYTATI